MQLRPARHPRPLPRVRRGAGRSEGMRRARRTFFSPWQAIFLLFLTLHVASHMRPLQVWWRRGNTRIAVYSADGFLGLTTWRDWPFGGKLDDHFVDFVPPDRGRSWRIPLVALVIGSAIPSVLCI